MAEKLMIAGSVDYALKVKGDNNTFLAGGTELNKLGSIVEASELISLKKLDDLKVISCEDGKVFVGAMCTFQEVIESELVPEYFKDACRMMASRTKRNMATIGGNIALLRDDSYIIPALLAAKAGILYATAEKEEDVCLCCYIAARKKGELGNALIKGIFLDPERRVISNRSANTAMSHSRMSISYGYNQDGSEIAVACEIKNCGIFRLKELEEKIAANPAISEEEILAWTRSFEAEIPTDMFGSEAYKRYLLGAIIARMIQDAGKEVSK